MGRSWTEIREDFPILKNAMNGQPLVYLDNAATSQKPQVVLDAIAAFYQKDNANIYRGTYELSQRATDLYEGAREKVAKFIGADRSEIVFTAGATASLNLAAFGYGLQVLRPGDEIAVTAADHHSNLVPWQEAAKMTGAKLVYLPLDLGGKVDVERVKKEQIIGKKTKILAIAQVTNVLGTEQPIAELINLVHQAGGVAVIDGAQAAGHLPVDVKKLDADFYAFSGHKMLSQTGIGVLYGKKKLLEATRPLFFGGEMIEEVGLTSATYKKAPYKFEAGSQNVSGAISLGSAIDYLTEIGLDKIAAREAELGKAAAAGLRAIPGVRVYGQGGGIVSFNLAGIHPHDLATALDAQGIAVRAGQHCAQPMMNFLQVPGTVRASFAFYNNEEDVSALITGVKEAKEFFHGLR
ncbi:SufS family cysteine desulfurase [Lactobacillus equicursoris]|uniref:SufS family cysteine desulfurase n=1 Tax=Lactobacillus equicursoris TaxID=420645 RepID=UPI003995A852